MAKARTFVRYTFVRYLTAEEELAILRDLQDLTVGYSAAVDRFAPLHLMRSALPNPSSPQAAAVTLTGHYLVSADQ